MRALSIASLRSELPLVACSICSAALIGYLYGMGRTEVMAALAGTLFFILLVWDLRIVVPILIVLLPFGPKFAMSFGNLYLATIVVIITFAAWIWRTPLLGRPLSLPRNRITDAVLILLAVLLVSSLQNVAFLLANTLYLLRFAQFFLYTGIFFIVLQTSFSRRQIKMLLALIIAAGIGQGMLGAWQWLTTPGYYVAGTFDSAHSSFAAYIVFIMLLILGVALESRNRWLMAGSALVVVVMLYPLAYSFSRGAYVALAGSLVVLLAMPVEKKRKAILALSVGTLAAVLLVAMPRDVALRAQTIISNVTGKQIGISFGGRLSMWSIALSDFARNPLLGAGTWRYGLRDSFFMKIIGEAGILGLSAFVWLLYVMLREQWRIVRMRVKDDFIRGIALGLFTATVGCLVIADFSIDLFLLHRLMGTFWIALALIWKYSQGDGRLAHVRS